MTAEEYLKQIIGKIAVDNAMIAAERDHLQDINRTLLAERQDLQLRLDALSDRPSDRPARRDRNAAAGSLDIPEIP
jgi:hypothetical protein